MKYHRDENTGQAFRIYAELFGEKDVYLELEGFRFEAASSGEIREANGQPRLVVQLPKEWAKKIGLLSGEAE